jgi:hypothetical protein
MPKMNDTEWLAVVRPLVADSCRGGLSGPVRAWNGGYRPEAGMLMQSKLNLPCSLASAANACRRML